VLISTNDDEIPTRGWKGISVMSWEMLVAHADEIIDAGTACVIADEAHYAKNPGAQRTKSLVAVLEKVPHGILLTGTPIKNVVVELHTLLSALDPETWGTRKAFAEAYVAEQKRTPGGGTQYIGVKDVGPLQKRLACSMVRRQKEDALKDLPKKERVYYQVPMSAAQRDAYMDAEENFLSWYEEAVEDRVRAELAREGVDDRTASAQARASAQAKAEAALRAQAIVKHVPPPQADTSKPLQVLITNIDYNDYVGRIGIGRIFCGRIKSGQQVAVIKHDGTKVMSKVQQLLESASESARLALKPSHWQPWL
jgi:hypothetical protein